MIYTRWKLNVVYAAKRNTAAECNNYPRKNVIKTNKVVNVKYDNFVMHNVIKVGTWSQTPESSGVNMRMACVFKQIIDGVGLRLQGSSPKYDIFGLFLCFGKQGKDHRSHRFSCYFLRSFIFW